MSARLSLWSDVQCNSGTMQSAIPPIVDGSARFRIEQTHRLEIVAPRDDAWLDSVDVRKVIRTELDNGDIYEWRIAGVEDGRGEGEPVTVVTADPIAADLRDAGLIKDTATGGITWFNLGLVGASPTEYIDSLILPSLTSAGVSYISRGTVDSSTTFDIAWDRWTPLQLMAELAARTGHEWQLRRNGSTDYKLDLVSEIGSSASQVLVAERRNLLRYVRTRDREGMATVIVPQGQQIAGGQERWGIGFAAWEVAGVIGSEVWLEDRHDGPGPAVFEDQLNDLYLLKTDGSLTQITDTVVTSSTRTTVTVADVTGLTQGDAVEIRADSSGTLVTELVDPTADRIVTTYENTDHRGERNYAINPFGTDWTTPSVDWGQAAGAQTSTTNLDVDQLGPNTVVAEDDLIVHMPGGSSPFSAIRRVTASTSVSGTGTATLPLNASITVADNDVVVVFKAPDPPRDWTKTSLLALVEQRDPEANTSLTGTYNGAPTGEAGEEVALSGLGADAKIYAGDVLKDDGTGTRRVIIHPATANSSGDASVVVDAQDSVSVSGDGTAVTIERPDIAAKSYDNAQVFFPQDTAPVVQTDPITVKAVGGLSTIWASAAFTVRAGTDARTIAAGGTYEPATLTLRDTGAGSDLASVTMDDVTLSRGEEQNVTLRAQYTLDSDKTLALRFTGLGLDPSQLTGSPSPVDIIHDPALYLRWVMLHIGTDSDAAPVDGSHATRLWQDGNVQLQKINSWPTEYSVTMRELHELWEGTPGEPKIQLGGTIRLRADDGSIDTTLRVVQVEHPLVGEPGDARIILSTRREGLTERGATKKPDAMFAEVTVETDADGKARSTTTTTPIPPTVAGSRRGVIVDGAVTLKTVTDADLGTD